MKVLSLALVGLCGYAGSAMAACPAGPDQANGGAWTAAAQNHGTVTIEEGGYAGTQCRLDAAVTGGVTSTALVEDDSPNAEPRYRAQFILNADALSGLSVTNSVQVFSATSASGVPISLSVSGGGSGTLLLNYIAANSSAGGSTIGSVALSSGENHVEFDLDNGSSSGSPHFSIWVNRNDESNPNFTTTSFNNGGATIETAYLGLSSPTSGYKTHYSGTAVGFDQFDSRRSTFIGGF